LHIGTDGADKGAARVSGLSQTLADLTEALDCQAGAILARSGSDTSFVIRHGLSDEAAESYTRFWHRRDPWLAALRGPFSGRAVRGEDLVGARLLRGSEFHGGWLAPNGFGTAAFAEIMPSADGTLLLCLWRAAGAGPLAKGDVGVLRAFAASVSLLLKQQEVAAGALVAGELLGRSMVPTALVGGDCTLLWANPAASALWGPEGPFRRVGGRIGLRHASLAQRFVAMILNAAQPGARAAIAALQTDEGVLPIRVQPLVLPSFGQVVALIGGIAGNALPGPGTISASLGLTRTQAEVAALLCRGLDTAAIADRLGISHNTLNGHLRELYERLHVSNRVQAVVRVLSSAASLTLLAPATAKDAGDAPCAPFEPYTPK
jgi:DNA-binding CsgD family transcriptional regulator